MPSKPDNERTRLLPKPDDASKPSQEAVELSFKRKTIILGSLWVAVFLGAADTTMVATLLSAISASFQSSNQLSWLGTSYLLTLAAFTPLYGRLSDIYGRKAANLIALVLFGSGTLGCGLAKSMNFLIFARCIAGAGAGGLMSISSIVASDLVPLKKRGLVQGIANLFYGLGAGVGGPIGGIISDTIGWRTAFLFQVPIVCLSIALVSLFVNYHVPGQGKGVTNGLKRIDWLGSFTLIIAVGGLLVSLSYKTNEDKAVSDPLVWVPFVVFVVFTILFACAEAFISKEPVMPLKILTARNPFLPLCCNFLISATGFVALYFFPMYFEAIRLQTSSEAGLHLIPNAIALSAGSLGAGLIMRKTGKYYWLLLFNTAIPILGLVAMCFLTETSSAFETWCDIIPAGIGIGAGTTVALVALISSVDRQDMAVATAMSYLFRYTGQVVGVAGAASIAQAVLTQQLRKRITGEGAAELVEKIRHESTIVRRLPPIQQQAAVESYKAALHACFAFGAALALLSVICSAFIKEYPLPGSFQEEEENRKARQNLE